MCEPEYETIWNGGEGLTTYGAQRPGAVCADVVPGCVDDWIDQDTWARAHPGSNPWRGRIVHDRRATVTDALYRWLQVDTARRWSRLVRFASWVSWPACELCGRATNTPRDFAPGLGSRAHRTPYHRAVCQSCYVRYRMARGRWKGAAIIREWVRVHHGVQTPEERKRRASLRYARRTAQRRALRSA